MLDVQLCIS